MAKNIVPGYDQFTLNEDGSITIPHGITNLQHQAIDAPLSSMLISGGIISEGTTGTVTVSAMTALLRKGTGATDSLTYVILAAQANQTMAAADTRYHVILDYNSGSPQILIQASGGTRTTQIGLGTCMKDAADNVHFQNSGMRLQDGVGKLQRRAASLRGSELVTGGCAIGDVGGGSKQFNIQKGVVYHGIHRLTPFAVSPYNPFISGDDNFIYIYGDTANGFTYTTIPADQTIIDNEYYYDGAGALALVTVQHYACHWVYIHPDDNDVYVMYGETNGKLAEAEQSQPPSDLPIELEDFAILLGCIIIQRDATAFTTIQMVTDYFFTGTAVANHSALANLEADDHIQYIKDSEFTQDGGILVGTGAGTFQEETAALDYGLSFEGIVTTYTDSTHFKVSTLAGKGTGFFKPAAGTPYEIYVVEADGGAPEGEQTPVVAYTTADGTFQHAAFTVDLAVGDIVLIMHPLIASLGTKGTTAAAGAVTTTDYLMAYIKQIVTLLLNGTYGLAALETLVDSIETWLGDPSGHTLATIAAKWGDIARTLDLIIGARWDASGDLGTDIVQLLTYCDLIDDATSGLANIKSLIDTLTTNVGTVDTVVDGIQTDLSNVTDGLGALKALLDAVIADTEDLQGNVDTMHDTDLPAVKTVVDALDTLTKAAGDGDLAAMKTAIDALSGYTHTDWKGNFNWDTSAYTTVETDISTLFSTNLAIATRRKYSVKLDLTTVEADGSFVSCYISVKEKIDGTNYRAIDRKLVEKADIASTAEPGIIIDIPTTSENIQITMQMTTATAGDCTIYYAVVMEALE